jgi:hypothetical protein
VTSEPPHWIEYGVFAFVIITAMATATVAWYTPREWESSVDSGAASCAPTFSRTNLIWQGTPKRPAAAKGATGEPCAGSNAPITRLTGEHPDDHRAAYRDSCGSRSLPGVRCKLAKSHDSIARGRSPRATQRSNSCRIVPLPVCSKRFKRSSMDPTLRAHKNPSGYPCAGRHGLYQGTK